MMKIKKIFLPAILTATLALTTVGCVSSTQPQDMKAPTPAVEYNDANFNVIADDIENVICSVKNKRVITEDDIENFNNLANRLDTYEGKKKTKVERVSKEVRSIAFNWTATTGMDLGEKNAAMLTQLCEGAKVR